MPRYWVIAPVEADPPDLFNKVWQFDLNNNVISIGWKALGDISKMTREELSKAIISTYPDKTPSVKGLITNMMWNFYHEIAPGDYVIARRGRKGFAGVGRVAVSAYYSPGKNPVHTHPNFLDISWQPEPRDKKFSSVVFPMYTVAEISNEEYGGFVEGHSNDVVQLPPTEKIEDANEFVLEKYLEEFIVTNFAAIFKNELTIYKDGDGNDGQQYATETGSIDILALERKSGSFVVIELKKGRSSDQVVGQILRYMGWVKVNLCKNGQVVRGLVICREPDPRLSYALAMTNNIDVRYYSVTFRLIDSETHLAGVH